MYQVKLLFQNSDSQKYMSNLSVSTSVKTDFVAFHYSLFLVLWLCQDGAIIVLDKLRNKIILFPPQLGHEAELD